MGQLPAEIRTIIIVIFVHFYPMLSSWMDIYIHTHNSTTSFTG